jgi:putative hydrolase of the HAD superfamily
LPAKLSPSKQLDEFVDRYTKDWSAPVAPIENVQTFLRRCQKQFITGLITNTHHEPMVASLLSSFALDGFKIVTTSVEHGRPKPHASIFLDTLEKLKIAPNNAVYVGDTYSADYIGATNAGLQCYLIGKHARVPREFQIPTVLDLPIHLF